MSYPISGIAAPSKYCQLTSGIELHYFCWNPNDKHKPVALLQHGTGFVAASFDQVAQSLTDYFRVYAYDRRGHGLSHKPRVGYGLLDFAEDCVGFCRALNLKDIYGIGHSAGATDLLIAESLQPGLFKQLFVMEPTINDPKAQALTLQEAQTKGNLPARILQARKRRAVFPSRQSVWETYREKPLFNPWQPLALGTYIYYGFTEQRDKTVVLQCHPDIEAEILKEIFITFANATIPESSGCGDDSKNGGPFAALPTITCPIAVSCSEFSGPQFKELHRRTLQYFPNAQSIMFAGLGHCVPQEGADYLVKEALYFCRD